MIVILTHHIVGACRRFILQGVRQQASRTAASILGKREKTYFGHSKTKKTEKFFKVAVFFFTSLRWISPPRQHPPNNFACLPKITVLFFFSQFV